MEGGICTLTRCNISSNQAKYSARASLAYIGPGAALLCYSTLQFEGWGKLFTVKVGGTLLLDGGIFPHQQAAGLNASFGDIESGALFILRNLPAYNGNTELQPTSGGSSSENSSCAASPGSANLPGLCPPYTTQTNYWKVKDGAEVVPDDDGCLTCTSPPGTQCTPACFRTTMWGVQCGSCSGSSRVVSSSTAAALAFPYLSSVCSCPAGHAGTLCSACSAGQFYSTAKTTIAPACTVCEPGIEIPPQNATTP